MKIKIKDLTEKQPKDVTVICNVIGQVKVKKEVQEVKIIKNKE